MWQWMDGSGSLPVFLALGAIGFLFLLFSFFFSEYLEAIELDDTPELEVETEAGGEPGVFSLRTLSIFLTGLGGLGAIAQLRGADAAISAAVGLAGGLTLAGLVYFFARYLYRQQSSSLVVIDELIGQRAEVIVSIPANGVGQVRCQLGEAMVEKIARSMDGEVISLGAPVRIEGITGETAIVRRWRPMEYGRSLFPPPESCAPSDAPHQQNSVED
jgi:membrane protein implicated in regulation of membrane protease activity